MANREQPLIFLSKLEEGPTFRVLSDLMTFKLGSVQTQGAFFLCFDQIPPQGGARMHQQPGQETFILFEGEIEFSTLSNGELVTFTASRGAIVHVPEGVAHAYRNVSTTLASMFVIFTPAGRTERFFEQLGVPVTDRMNLPPPHFPVPEELRALLQEYQVRQVVLPSSD